MIDLNSYFILVLNEDSTITVVDPNVLIAGVGDMFFTQVILNRPGADWVQTRDQKRLFVSMPRANAVAVVDTETFRLTGHIKTGKEPFRVALQGDEKYLWVGNNAKGKDGGGITVVDVETLKVAATIETGKGHHEIAFSDDDRYALITNRNDGTASLIDIQSLKKIKDIEIGAMPISVSYSKLSKAFYVADGEKGVIVVVDAAKRQVTARIAVKSGLGPMGITAEGRWVLVTNSVADLVHVIDTATNEIAHDVAIPGRPFKISLTRAFAYVRALDSERVSMINLAMLGETGNPPVVTFPAGAKPPSAASSLGVADSIVEAAGEAGVVLVSPAENTLYYYMEGMNAPIGNFRSYGHNPRAVMVTDRSLDEREPGAYSAKIQIPVAGTYDVAFILDSPRILHCFSVEAKENPLLKKDLKPLEVEYLVEEKRVAAGQTVPLRFRLIDPATEQPRSGLEDVRVLSYRSPGRNRTVTSAKEVGDGIYEVDLAFPRHGAYFVFVSSRSSKVPFGELPYLTMRAFRDKAALEKALSAKGTGG
jgi:YVTN family beta-propeller protein